MWEKIELLPPGALKGVFGLNLLLLKTENWKLKTENTVIK